VVLSIFLSPEDESTILRKSSKLRLIVLLSPRLQQYVK